MKNSTAIKIVKSIANRLHKNAGIIGTPECNWTAFKIKRLWVFGSTIKGKENPNDVDILFEGYPAGMRQFTNKWQRKGYHKDSWVSKNTAQNSKSNFGGCIFAKDSELTALRYLRNNSKLVRFHNIEYDGELAYPRVMLYPRFELDI